METSGDLGNKLVISLPTFVDCLEDLLRHMYSISPGEPLSMKHITFAIILLRTGHLHYGAVSGDFARQGPAIRGVFVDRV
jgi:hypothetical protein